MASKPIMDPNYKYVKEDYDYTSADYKYTDDKYVYVKNVKADAGTTPTTPTTPTLIESTNEVKSKK